MVTADRIKSERRFSVLSAGGLAIFLVFAVNCGAQAQDFQVGNLQGVFDLTVSYGLGIRIEDTDESLVAAANGGDGSSVNNDDGNLNYDTGIFSNALRGNAELTMLWGGIGIFARGAAGYDYETEDQSRERTDLTSSGRELLGSDADLLDHYISGSFRVADIPVHFRLGDQVVNWGETNFVREGIDVINPVDLVGGDGVNQAMLTGGQYSDLGTDLDDAFRLPAGTLGFDENFFQIPGRYVDEPDDGGQYGLSLIGRFFDGLATKIGLHYIRYNSRLPIVSGLTASQAAINQTSDASVAETASDLEPVYLGTGLTPDEAAAEARETAEQLTLSQYDNAAGYFAEYPEDIDMLGVSFSFSTIRTGTLFAGEFSRHKDFPFQIATGQVLTATRSPVQYDPTIGDTPLGQFGADQVVSGVLERDRTQFTMSVTQLLGPRLGSDQVLIGADAAFVNVDDVSGNGGIALQAVKSPTDNSWGYRLSLASIYSSVFGALNVVPRIVFVHDVSGTTPAPLSTFVEDRKLVQFGVSADFIDRWSTDLSFTGFFGAGNANLLSDRDIVRWRLTYSF
ncbi:MAG: DUF1302 family protein [Chromatiales bacterium]